MASCDAVVSAGSPVTALMAPPSYQQQRQIGSHLLLLGRGVSAPLAELSGEGQDGGGDRGVHGRSAGRTS